MAAATNTQSHHVHSRWLLHGFAHRERTENRTRKVGIVSLRKAGKS